MRLSEDAPAKINLALHVRRRRPDGYHEIETLFAFCEAGDTLSAAPAEALSLTVDGLFAAALAGEGDNLVLRAARALAASAGRPPLAALTLTKRLPVASGLGGGSADAAAALRTLNRLWALAWPLDRLAAIGAALGADVPACVHGRAMRGEGVGERLAPVALPPAPVLLVNPGVAVSTAAVFRAWDGADRGPLIHGDPWTTARDGRNDLEAPAVALAPAIADTLALLRAQPHAQLVRMSGSGATCFAVFDTDEACAAAAVTIAAARPRWWIQPTRLQSQKP